MREVRRGFSDAVYGRVGSDYPLHQMLYGGGRVVCYNENMVSLYITCKNREEGEKIADALMERRAAGCVNMFPSQSVWRDDDGTVKKADEIVLIVKTLESKIPTVEEIVVSLGSYKAPCIASTNVDRVNREYKEWLGRTVG